MTYAIRRNNGDVYYFDAITNVDETYSAKVTRHPVASGGLISDHTTIDNMKFNISAVLSDADFNMHRPDANETVNNLDKDFVNNSETRTPVEIKSSTPRWRNFLPEVVSQFTANAIPEVIVTPQSKVKTANAVRFDLVDMFDNRETFTLLEYDENLISRSFDNMVMTGLSFKEDADSGDALYPVFQMEQVRYTDVAFVKVKIRPTVDNKGRKTGESKKKPTEDGDDAQNGPTSDAGKTAAARLADKAAAQ
jgi:hypothetical protein